MDSKAFWKHVDTKTEVLLDAHGERRRAFRDSGDKATFQGQPEDGKSLYIVSIENLEKNITPGQVVQCTYRIGGQRLIESTHRVATAEEISTFLEGREVEKKHIRKEAQDRKQQFVVNVPAAGVTQAPAPATDLTSPEFAAAVAAAVKQALTAMKAAKDNK